MKRLKAAMCAVLAGLMLAGCGSKEVITCRAEGPAAAVDLTQYAVKEAAYPAYPAEPRFEDYFDENGEGDWDAYDAAYTEYREALRERDEQRLYRLLDEGKRRKEEVDGCKK